VGGLHNWSVSAARLVVAAGLTKGEHTLVGRCILSVFVWPQVYIGEWPTCACVCACDKSVVSIGKEKQNLYLWVDWSKRQALTNGEVTDLGISGLSFATPVIQDEEKREQSMSM